MEKGEKRAKEKKGERKRKEKEEKTKFRYGIMFNLSILGFWYEFPWRIDAPLV